MFELCRMFSFPVSSLWLIESPIMFHPAEKMSLIKVDRDGMQRTWSGMNRKTMRGQITSKMLHPECSTTVLPWQRATPPITPGTRHHYTYGDFPAHAHSVDCSWVIHSDGMCIVPFGWVFANCKCLDWVVAARKWHLFTWRRARHQRGQP